MKKLIIIDDEFIFRQGLKYMMDWEAFGYTIVGEASNGKEGMDIVLREKPDIILCDVVMPGISGTEFVKLIQKTGGPPVVMLSNFDEFDKVREAFQFGAADYLLKNRVTKESLLECLDRIIPSKEKFILQETEKTFGILTRKVLDGYAECNSLDFVSYIKEKISGESYQLLLLQSPKPDFENEEHLQQYLKKEYPGRGILSCFTTQNHAIVLFSVPSYYEETGQTEQLLETLSARIRHTSCVISVPFSDISLLREKAEKLLDLCAYSILYENRLCFYEKELIKPSDAIPIPTFQTDLYTSYTKNGKWKEASELLLEYMEQLKNSVKMNPFRFKKFIEHIFYNSLKDARMFTKEYPEISRIELKFFKQMDSILTFTQLCEVITWAYGEISAVSGGKENLDDVVNALHDYLEHHYMEQITLYDVADFLHMNYSYLSAYISNKTGKHFSEHLNDTRIRRARILLSDFSLTISQISEKIGYADQSYFGKVFKKQVGLTPLQFRNLMKGN